jgi:LAO/AO transport system kinase
MVGMENKDQKKNPGLKILKGVEQPDTLNISAITKHKSGKPANFSVQEYVDGILQGNRMLLSRAITLIESSLSRHQILAQQILDKCLPFSGNSIRIGITGIPGVGKSTFIEAIGSSLIRDGKKVAVLAVDPSSSKSRGSILGDKTRMAKLSVDENAFIRPSPSAGTLGGVARKTRETIMLCEAAGYNTLLIETVGVGQSETTVHSMVDFFLVLMLPGAGDELQGIKRGIMELADMIVLNKSDDHTIERINLAERIFQNALHFFPPNESGWIPKVQHCSSVSLSGISEVWDVITEYQEFTSANGYFEQNRMNQAKFWLYETINSELLRSFSSDKKIHYRIKLLEQEVLSHKMSPFVAAQELLNIYLGKA